MRLYTLCRTLPGCLRPCLLLALGLLLWGQEGMAQEVDTLTLARQAQAEKQYGHACRLLQAYLAVHPKDADAYWLLGQTEYWRQQPRKARTAYAKAYALHPHHEALAMDYARTLAELGQTTAATTVLNRIHGPASADRVLLQAKALYYAGRLPEARKQAAAALALAPSHVGAQALNDELAVTMSPWAQIGTTVGVDDQPMRWVVPKLSAGYYVNPLFAPTATLQTPIYRVDGQSRSMQQFTLANKALFPQSRTQVGLELGLAHFYNRENAVLASFTVRQPLGRLIQLEAVAERMPYLSTRISTDSSLLQNRIAVSASLVQFRWLSGSAGYQVQLFDDGNYVSSYFVYGFAPQITLGPTVWRIGYGYNNADSYRSRYLASETVEQAVAKFATTTAIPAHYDPYFTPKDQHSHSVLASVEAFTNRRVAFGGSGSYGFSAYTQNPYLYLNSDASGGLVFDRSYSTYRFTPYQVQAYLRWVLARPAELKLQYEHRTNPFYTSNVLSLSFLYRFL